MAFDVYAQTPPIPQNKEEAIGNYEARLKAHKAEQAAIEKKKAETQKSLNTTREKLVDLARSIQKNESSIQSLSTQIKEQEVSKDAILSTLEADRLAVSHLILALERIRRVPPEAMIAKPDAPIKTARSAMLMKEIIPALRAKADALKDKLEKLEAIEADLKQKKDKALIASKALKEEQKEMKASVAERERLYANLDKDYKARQQKVKEISERAKTLSELVTRLEDERTRNQRGARRSNKVAALPRMGEKQLPLRGVIQTHYDEADTLGAKSKGLSIEGKAGSLIVSPMGGVVRFAGYFKHYGNMVIIEHENGYHSLIAGFEKIDTVVDQSLLAGEPVGTLYKGSNGKAPTLYFELRRNGKAVNPAKHFADLG